MIRIKNNSGGYLSLFLDDYTGIKPSRWFVLPTENSEIAIPNDYAQSITIEGGANTAWKKGLFIFTSGEDEFKQFFAETGTQSEEDLEKTTSNIISNITLLSILQNGKLERVKELIHSPNVDRLVQLARDNVGTIAVEKIALIEQETGIVLRIDE